MLSEKSLKLISQLHRIKQFHKSLNEENFNSQRTFNILCESIKLCQESIEKLPLVCQNIEYLSNLHYLKNLNVINRSFKEMSSYLKRIITLSETIINEIAKYELSNS